MQIKFPVYDFNFELSFKHSKNCFQVEKLCAAKCQCSKSHTMMLVMLQNKQLAINLKQNSPLIFTFFMD